MTLGIERRLGRVNVFGASLVSGFECTCGEGDDAAGFVGDGEDDALAEAVVERAGGAVFLVFRGEEAGLAEGFLVGEGFEALAEGVEIVGGVADAEFGYAVGAEAAAGEVFAS